MTNASERKRVRVLYTGGMSFTEKYTPEKAKTILQEYLDLQLVADTDISIISNTAGANITWDTAKQIGEEIAQYYKYYDGFVVIHSIDNVLYTANLLRFCLPSLSKPIVFTGSTVNHEIDQLLVSSDSDELAMYQQIDLRTNLVTAVQTAVLDVNDVLLAYGSEIIRSVRARFDTNNTQDLISYLEPPVATIQFDIQLNVDFIKHKGTNLKYQTEFETDVAVIDLYPESDIKIQNLANKKAIIIKGYQEKIFPDSLSLPTDIPVIIISASHQIIPQDNVLIVDNVTLPVVLTKTMVGIANTNSLVEFKKYFLTNLFNEFIK